MDLITKLFSGDRLRSLELDKLKNPSIKEVIQIRTSISWSPRTLCMFSIHFEVICMVSTTIFRDISEWHLVFIPFCAKFDISAFYFTAQETGKPTREEYKRTTNPASSLKRQGVDSHLLSIIVSSNISTFISKVVQHFHLNFGTEPATPENGNRV